ncbi:tRNA (adenine-N1)-methyltransferase [Thermotoga sp. KOL6]|uniref:tRNA (adenine-N1)-methyltransferase n=1 Tax=Thermotoga sp. KOL6 TaxID=126741 RepID=UPI000CAB1341|nr:tRNA (adenine-N1)-methyltransferase [Thermotoga sp. KOL6]PLV59448.1 SAM-dependent methyltransferase [Thermotoga sp. KOL6]
MAGALKPGERVLLSFEDESEFLVNLEIGKRLHTHLGVIDLNEVLEKEPGEIIRTSVGKKGYILKPRLIDEIMNMKRRTQIVYPKDSSFIVMMLDVKEGDKVIDTGVGSGAMCAVLARNVGSTGRVFAYERREEFAKLAESNLKSWGLINRVTIKVRDISEGFDEKNVDSLFLDVPDPWNYIDRCWEALRGGGRFATVCPTTNQVQETLKKLHEFPFVKIEVWESLFRQYKPVPERLRPMDRMVAHTAYMIFATKVCRREEI